jgi:hypothetical protein
VYLSLQVAGLAGGPLVVPLEAAPARPPGLLERLVPRAAKSHDLGSVDEAPARKGHHVGLLFAPLREGGGPLDRPPQLVGRLAAEDHAAVDDAARDRRQLPGRDRHHRLVQEPEALLHLAPLDHEMTLVVAGERYEVPVTEALADPDCLRRHCDRALEIALRFALEHHRDQEVALLDAFTALAIHEALRSSEPAARAPHLALLDEVDPHPERAACRGQGFTRVQASLVGALERVVEVAVTAEHVGGDCQQLEVAGFQGRLSIGHRQGRIGVAPSPFCVELAASFDVGEGVHRLVIIAPASRLGVIRAQSLRDPAPWLSLARRAAGDRAVGGVVRLVRALPAGL